MTALGCFFPAPALGHAFLLAAEPAPESLLPAAPRELVLRFTEPIVANTGSITPLDQAGRALTDGGFAVADDPNQAIVALPRLSPGIYYVQFRVVSALDGHTESGAYWFRIASGPGIASEGGGIASIDETAAGPLPAAVRALGFLSALALFGLPAVQWIARIGPSSTSNRARRALLAASVVQSGYWGVVWIGQYRTVLPDLGLGPRFWWTAATMTVLTLAYAVYLAVGPRARAGFAAQEPTHERWVSSGVGNVSITAYALTGHSLSVAATPVSALLFDLVHLMGAGVWTGAIVRLALSVGEGGEARPWILRLTGTVAASFILLAATGIFGAESRGVPLDEPGRITETAYGAAFGWKLGLVGIMAVFGTLHAFPFNPWRNSGAGRRPWRIVLGAELASLILVLGATAVMTLSPPIGGRQSTAEQPALGLTLSTHVGPTLVETTITPNLPGENTAYVRLSTVRGPVPASRVRLALNGTGAAADLRPVRGEPGLFAGNIALPEAPDGSKALGDPYEAIVRIEAEDGNVQRAVIPAWPVPAPGGAALLGLAKERIEERASVRVFERLSDGVNTVEKVWWYEAPDKVRAEVVDGDEAMIVIGTDRWTREDGAWERDALREPLKVPAFTYADRATEVEILGVERIDGNLTIAVAFRYDTGDYRFVAWIDAATYLPVRLSMIGPGHFMDWRYDAYDRPVNISPPT